MKPTRISFAAGLVGLTLLEFAMVYFIMPLPGSQRIRSIDLAYFLYRWRWPLRLGLGLAILVGLATILQAGSWKRWVGVLALVLVGAIVYLTNFQMAADRIFREPTVVRLEPAGRSEVPLDRLVVGLAVDGEARAYPLQLIGYHHKVRDRVGHQEILVTYCTVCRTGRVFTPLVDGRTETFRLVGMDHFNAMLEDQSTGSWWRQANGEAITGPRKGTRLPELTSHQVTLRQWLALYPGSLIMQPDPVFAAQYANDYAYEKGTSRSVLTGTDTVSWHDKSWVIGITVNGRSKAYDWNELRRERIINDAVGDTPIVVALGEDGASFFAFLRPDPSTRFTLRADSLVTGDAVYALNGSGSKGTLSAVNASQEFWHSWRTFQPDTERH